MTSSSKKLCLLASALVASAGNAPEPQAPAVAAASSAIEHKAGIVRANGIDIAYQIDGRADGVPLLFILGLGGQMADGPDPLTDALVARGFKVIRFDNRDAGKSTHMTAAGAPPAMDVIVKAMKEGKQPPLAYTIKDMAQDALALMDALGIKKAHILGGSMGGMIAQILVSEHPDRALSLIAVSSTSGNPAIPYGPALNTLIEATSVRGGTDEEVLDRKVRLFQAIEGSKYKVDPAVLREKLRKEMKVATDPFAISRQGVASIPYSDRRAWLKAIKVPALIIQGADDPLFPVAHARDEAANIPGAEIEIIPGMGHTLPDPLAPMVADLIAKHLIHTP